MNDSLKAMHTDAELRSMSHNERSHIEAMMGGSGILISLFVLYYFFLSAKYFFLDVPFIEPLYFITNPIWIIPLLFLARSIFFKVLLAIFITISLPLLFSLSFAIQDFSYGMGLNIKQFFIHLDTIYQYAYGDIGSKLEHIMISKNLGIKGHEIFMHGIIIVNLLVLTISFSMFYRVCYDIIQGVSKKSKDLEINGTVEYLFGLFIIFLTYHILSPLIFMSKELPYGLGIFITWNVIFYPFLGIRLALTNSKRKVEDKIGTIFTRYYIVMGLFAFPLYLYINGSLISGINAILSGDMIAILFYLPVILVPFLIYSLKDKTEKVSSD